MSVIQTLWSLCLVYGVLSSQDIVPPAVQPTSAATTTPLIRAHTKAKTQATAASSSSTTTQGVTSTTTPSSPLFTEDSWYDKRREEGGRQKAALAALHYIELHRKADWGWGNDTHRAIVALQFVNDTKNEVEASQPSLEIQLSTKQLETELLVLLWRHEERDTPIPSRQLASYILAFVSLCRDPRDFHSHDMVGVLLHREPSHAHDLALASLASCTAGARARRRHVRRLLDAASAQAEHNIDTMAMVILALRCIIKDHRHRSLQPFLRRPLTGLARQQLPDGSFGSVKATALAIQALEDAENGSQQQWNESAALQWLIRQQGPRGGFGDLSSTVEAALALSGAVVAAPKRCPHSDLPPFDSHDPSENYPKIGNNGGIRTYNETDNNRNVSFTYTLWIGTNVTDNYTLFMTAPRNISFYHVMQMASEQDTHFEFSASEWPNGHYVHTLAGCREEPMGYHYWLLYKLHDQPDPNNPPGNNWVAPVGVDDLLVDDGEHYLFWYKKL